MEISSASKLTVNESAYISEEILVQRCPVNPDNQYDRQLILNQFNDILKMSVPEYVAYPNLSEGFFIYDLTDPSNKYTSPTDCINFVNNHIYYFSVVYIPFSRSHIAILANRSLKVFNLGNCKDSKDKLEDVLSYIQQQLKNDKNKEDIINRVKNYRRYGKYLTDDEFAVRCERSSKIPENPDKLYVRWKILERFAQVLDSFAPELTRPHYSRFFVEESRANGFFIYDLTEPANKQTSLLERVDFKNNHIYHFAYIDSPFSFSHIAILEDGKLRVFRGVNCQGKGDKIEDVISYLNKRLKHDKNKDEIINQVKNYRKYGVYASFDGSSVPRCEAVGGGNR